MHPNRCMLPAKLTINDKLLIKSDLRKTTKFVFETKCHMKIKLNISCVIVTQ